MPEKDDNGLVVLLVEDEDVLRRTYRRALEGEGYSVIEASDGNQALEYFLDPLEHFKGSQPHLILTDINMPGMSGDIFLKNLRDKGYRGIPTLIMSGFPNQQEFSDALNLARQQYSQSQIESLQLELNMAFDKIVGLVKPFSLRNLRERVVAINSVVFNYE